MQKSQENRKKIARKVTIKKIFLPHKIAKFIIMKQKLLFFTLLFIVINLSFSQERSITRGATPGEFYLTAAWYGIYSAWGPPYYDTLRTAVFRLTENGKKLTKQYDANYFANPEIIMQPNVILADATPGVVYNKDNYSKNSYSHTALWVSFDYGENWMFREENLGSKYYFTTNVDGFIYRGGGGVFKSINYGQIFLLEEGASYWNPGEPGIEKEEVFSAGAMVLYQGKLTHTYDYYRTYTQIPIDSQFMFGQICGIFPDVYRGGLPGEVYISSLFPGASYKVSFSADTGHTFRHVFMQNEAYCDQPGFPVFMSDRESGVFYIVRSHEIEDNDPWGWHTKICVEYYRDYGETLVDTYCHDITKDYGSGVGVEPITNYELRITVFPNPTTGELRISGFGFRVTEVEVFDIYGRKVLEPPLTVLHSYDITVLQPGVYFVKITTEKGVVTKKIIKH